MRYIITLMCLCIFYSNFLLSQAALKLTFDSAGNRINQRMECQEEEAVSNCFTFSRFKYFPNPASNEAFFGFEINESDYVNVSLVNMSRNVITNIIDATLEPGYYFEYLDLTAIPNGIYFIRMLACGRVQYSKIIVLKK